MKKVLILILIALLGFAMYVVVYKNIKLGTWKTTNIEELRGLKRDLDKGIKTARELSDREYANQIDELNKSIRRLKQSKETYESKKTYLNEDEEIGLVKIKEYKIEYLWAVVQNYAIDQELVIKLDLIENDENNIYNINITAKGQYQGIMNFIESIEKDDTLDFKIEDFKLTPLVISSTPTGDGKNTQKVTADTSTLQAMFTIKNVKIELN